jgi:hypothetical protein
MSGTFRRRVHARHLKSGVMSHVSECWPELRRRKPKRKRKRKLSRCQFCGAQIFKVPMPNNGWGHFERGAGLSRVKHPCYDVGDGLSQNRDDETLDLFSVNADEH